MVICVKQRYYKLKEVRFHRLCKKIGVAGQNYYRWRKEYGSLSVEKAKRLKEAEKENTRLRKLVEYTAHLNFRVLDSEKSEWLSSKINEWANESRSLALKYAYSLEERKLSKKYIKRDIEILNQRIVQAGIRWQVY